MKELALRSSDKDSSGCRKSNIRSAYAAAVRLDRCDGVRTVLLASPLLRQYGVPYSMWRVAGFVNAVPHAHTV